MLQLNVSQASTICRASGRAMRSLGIWCGRARFASSRKTFLFLGPEKKQGPRKSPGPGNRGPKGPGFQGYALPKAVALVPPARRAQTFKILGFFSEAEEARLQYKTES